MFVAEIPQQTQSGGTLAENFNNNGEFNNLMQQMIIFIFVELWKKSTNDLH